MLNAERETRGHSRTFVKYQDLLEDWRNTVEHVGNDLAITWPHRPEQVADSIDGFLSKDLRHYQENDPLPDHPACHLARKAYMELLARRGETELSRLSDAYDELVKLMTPWETRLVKLNARVREIEHINSLLTTELARIKGTVSWRITAPLRYLWNMFKRFPA
jgi:hypothetical protein